MKGIVLAGGYGTRLGALTKSVSKQLLPVYDQPLIHYPLHTLKQLGCDDIAIITRPDNQEQFQVLLGSDFTYLTQDKPEGIAQAPIIAQEWLNGEPFYLILGDNIFIEAPRLADYAPMVDGPVICLADVAKPWRYGCLVRDKKLVEKPILGRNEAKAVAGLYFLPGFAPSIARTMRKSRRGELEILSLITKLQDEIRITWPSYRTVRALEMGHPWFDCGTPEDLLDAANCIKALRTRHNSKLGIL